MQDSRRLFLYVETNVIHRLCKYDTYLFLKFIRLNDASGSNGCHFETQALFVEQQCTYVIWVHLSKCNLSRQMSNWRLKARRNPNVSVEVMSVVFMISIYSCFDKECNVKAYATMPVDIMGSKCLMLLDWGSRFRARRKENCAVSFYTPETPLAPIMEP